VRIPDWKERKKQQFVNFVRESWWEGGREIENRDRECSSRDLHREVTELI
jgi:hypothetical protein